MAAAAGSPLYMHEQRSAWHSPVPYLFGGLAAMLGLIAFALFILACSYWKLSTHLQNTSDGSPTDVEAGEQAGNHEKTQVFDEKCVVIMAGQVKPTYLATPMWSRAMSFESNTSSSTGSTDTTIPSFTS